VSDGTEAEPLTLRRRNQGRILRYLAGLLTPALLAACAGGPHIDRTYSAVSQGSRVQYVILHFTWEDWPTSLEILSRGPVSSHYLVRDDPVRIYRLVDESRRAFHAGRSSWRGRSNLNSASIGIEIVNGGNRADADGNVVWQPYPDAQIDAVVRLVEWIVARHDVPPQNVLGHSDIAPLRRLDPGPLFPWRRLAEAGLIPWPDENLVAERLAVYQGELPPIPWFQQKLAEHGFEIEQTGELDDATRRVIAAFQMKYRPARHDGEPDAETAAMLDAITTRP
jgi:N-acetylmuramoyl-L-alanine amidase